MSLPVDTSYIILQAHSKIMILECEGQSELQDGKSGSQKEVSSSTWYSSYLIK